MKKSISRATTYEWILLVFLIIVNVSYIIFKLFPAFQSVFVVIWLVPFLLFDVLQNFIISLIIYSFVYLLLSVLLLRNLIRNKSLIFLHALTFLLLVLQFVTFIDFLIGLHAAAGV